jgi:DNA polymerase-3 subunit beta
LPVRTALPILSGVLIEAKGENVTFSTFDYEASSKTTVTATVDEPGRVLVPGRLLNDIAGRLPQAPVTLELNDTKVLVTCGSAKFSLPCMPVDEYPTIPTVEGSTGVVPGEEFAAAVSQVVVAASREDSMPVINGVQLEISGTTLSMMATDRYRVAIKEVPWDAGSTPVDHAALVPARTMQEIGKTFGSSPTISITLATKDDREVIAFHADNKTVTSLLIKGTFPPVRRLFPDVIENFAVVNTAELIEATRRVKLVVEREAALKYIFRDNTITLEAVGGDQAQASETIDAVITGLELTVSLKPDLLLDGLSAVHSEFTRLGFNNGDNPSKPGPVLITSHTSKEGAADSTFRYLLQPNLLLR